MVLHHTHAHNVHVPHAGL